MTGSNRIENVKKPVIYPVGFYPFLFGFYLVSNFILQDLSVSIRSLSGKW